MPRYKRGSGSVYLRGKTWWVAYYDLDGKQVCESAKTKDKTEARRILQARLGQLAEGRYVGPAADKVTVTQLFDLVTGDYTANANVDQSRLSLQQDGDYEARCCLSRGIEWTLKRVVFV